MPFVRPDVANLLSMLAAAPGPKMEEGDAATARGMMRMMGQVAELPRGDIAHVTDFTSPRRTATSSQRARIAPL